MHKYNYTRVLSINLTHHEHLIIEKFDFSKLLMFAIILLGEYTTIIQVSVFKYMPSINRSNQFSSIFKDWDFIIRLVKFPRLI